MAYHCVAPARQLAAPARSRVRGRPPLPTGAMGRPRRDRDGPTGGRKFGILASSLPRKSPFCSEGDTRCQGNDQAGRQTWLKSWHRSAQPGRKLGISPVGSPAGAMGCQQTGQAGRAGAKNLGTLGHDVAKTLPPHLSFGVKTGQSAQNLGNLARKMTRNLASRQRGRPRCPGSRQFAPGTAQKIATWRVDPGRRRERWQTS